MALLNLVLSVFLIDLYGVLGAVIGTAISLIIANGIIMNIYYHKKCNIDIFAFWKNILRISVGLIVPVCLGILMMKFLEISSIFVLLAGILAYTFTYLTSIYFFGMNQTEKRFISAPIKKVFHKDK
jgi:O-antigen/teichoic acid export membrane protein